jgi:hypothetical protein
MVYTMAQPLTADDILPLLAQLSPQERARFFRLITSNGGDAKAYRVVPPGPDEFGSDEDLLGWDAQGWENVG